MIVIGASAANSVKPSKLAMVDRLFRQLSELDVSAAIEFSLRWADEFGKPTRMINLYPLEGYLVGNGFIAHVSNDLSGGPVKVDEFTIKVLRIIKDLGYKIIPTPHGYFTI